MLSRSLLVGISLAALASFSAFAQNAAPAPVVPAVAAPAASGGDRPVTRAEIPGLVREALMNDPEMIKEAVQRLREKQEAEAKKKTGDGIVKNKDNLFNNPDSPVVGAADADVTLVEFFDYHCGYCKRMLPEMSKLMGEDKKLRVIFKEYPILSEDSVTAAKAALAVNRIAKDKYFAFHTALMKSTAKFDEKSLLDMAKKQGISVDKLKTEMAKPELTAILDKNREIASEIGITGTPGIILGGELIPGALPYEDLKKAVGAAREGKNPTKALEEAAKKPAEKKAAAPAAPAEAAAAPAAPAEQPKN